METISISKLKTHLSAEIKKVRRGTHITILDHKHPVAQLIPTEKEGDLFLREASRQYVYQQLAPLIDIDPMDDIAEERSDRW